MSSFYMIFSSGIFSSVCLFNFCIYSGDINRVICFPFSLFSISLSKALVFYLIYNDPSPIKLFKITTILSNYLSKYFGNNVIFSRIWIMTCLMGMALEV
jgi:hypothetical protein